MESLVRDILEKKVFAVVGVSRDKKKYGRKVYEDLKSIGKKVFAINPNLGEIETEKVYADIKDLPQKPEVLVLVVQPRITEKIIKDLEEGIIVWIQPGAESEEAINLCKKKSIKCIWGMCIMVKRKVYKNNKSNKLKGEK